MSLLPDALNDALVSSQYGLHISLLPKQILWPACLTLKPFFLLAPRYLLKKFQSLRSGSFQPVGHAFMAAFHV